MRKEKIATLLLEKQKRMADASLYYFCKYILQFSLLEIQPHWELCSFIEKNGQRDCLILLPRGTFKSTVISVGYSLWRLTKNRNLRILISSSKEENVKGWIGQIKTILSTNQIFRRMYGEWDTLKNVGPWHTTAITIPGRTKGTAQPTISGSSVGSSEVSQHYDLFIGDDLQTDANIATREMIDEIDMYVQKLIPLLDPQEETGLPGARILVGTRWGFDDVYGRAIAKDHQARRSNRPETYKRLIRKAYTNRSVYFPSRFSKDVLDHMRKTSGMSDYLFSCQFLNDPQPEGTEVFSLKDFGFFWSDGNQGQCVMRGQVTNLPPLLNKFTTVDPSLGETSDSDYTAMITVAVDSAWNYYIWNVVRERMNVDQIIEALFRIHKTYAPYRLGMEAVVFQRALIYGFERACRERGTWFHIESLHTDNTVSKEQRIRGFQPFIRAGKVYFRVSEKNPLTDSPSEMLYSLLDGQDALVDELIRFPVGGTRDCVDALAYLPQLVFPAGEPPKPPPDPMSFEALRARVQRTQRSPLRIG